MNILTLTLWMAAAPGGASHAYHTGLLMRDRQHNADLNVLAAHIWALYEAGAVSLRQRRHAQGTEYLVVNLPHAGARWEGCYKAQHGVG